MILHTEGRPLRRLACRCKFVTASITALALLASVSIVWAQGEEALLLEVYVNGHSIGKIGEFTLRDQKLFLRQSELTDLGFRLPSFPQGAPPTDELVALSAIRGLTSRVIAADQSVHIIVPDDQLLPTTLNIEDKVASAGSARTESGTGMTVNYDFAGTFTGDRKSNIATIDARAFAPWGVLSSGLLGGSSFTGDAHMKATLVRLDSTYSFGDVHTLRRYSVGDFITSGLSWTRPVRLEGLQVRSDFSMRPDLVTFPLPTVRGSVAIPSAVDVLANGNLVTSQQVMAGPFEVSQLPVPSGAGTISMTVTDAMGQQVRVNQPFYASAALLRPGLQSFSLQAGLVRLNWGAASNDFGKAAASATYRRGLTDRFTIEGDAEGAAGTMMGGGGGLLQVGHLGTLNLAVAASGGSAHAGALGTAGFQRLGRVLSLGASTTAATAGFEDVAARNGDPVPRRQSSANLGITLRHFGSVGVFYADIGRTNVSNQTSLLGTAVQGARVLSASYSMPLRRISFFINSFAELDGSSKPGVQLGLTLPFGRRQLTELSVGSDGSEQVQVQKSITRIGDAGYNAYLSRGGGTHEFVEGEYKSRLGLLTAGVDNDAGATSVRVATQGAVSLVDGGIFPSNTIYDSFAIVDTGARPHVHVLQENRDVGETGSSGRLLVTDLRSYDLNRLAIVSTDIGIDTTIQQPERQVRPRDRSGIVVRFALKISHAALLELVDEAGKPLPLGSTAKLRGSRAVVPVGYGGAAYVEDLKPLNELDVATPDGGSCIATFHYTSIAGEIPKIGPVRCVEVRPGQPPVIASSAETGH